MLTTMLMIDRRLSIIQTMLLRYSDRKLEFEMAIEMKTRYLVVATRIVLLGNAGFGFGKVTALGPTPGNARSSA